MNCSKRAESARGRKTRGLAQGHCTGTSLAGARASFHPLTRPSATVSPLAQKSSPSRGLRPPSARWGEGRKPRRPLLQWRGAKTLEKKAAALLVIAFVALAQSRSAFGQTADLSRAAANRNAAARIAFQDDKFGLFIHWGVYALVGKGEWVMDRDKLPVNQYAKLPPRFIPAKFDAETWVKLAVTAGARYITITSKHHDGFCMFESKLTDYDIAQATPFHRDPLRELADACHRHKIKLFFYYSLLDWHHPDYYPLGKTGHSSGREAKGDWLRYVAYYQGQVRELCTDYGELGGIWFDGWWDRPQAEWDLAGTYRLIHELQPGALIGNNHHVTPFPGEDFQMFEQDLPGENKAGFNKAAVDAGLPLEMCLTINSSWGFNVSDTNYKSAPEIVRALVSAAGRGSNLLLNVGPGPDGTIGPEPVARLEETGKWLGTYGESVYGTRRGPITPQKWGVSTTKGAKGDQKIFLHILNPDEAHALKFERSSSWTPFLFGKTTPLKWTEGPAALALDLPKDALMPIDTIVVLRPNSGKR
jgi:alpha-L-fucosidase